jgi:ATP-dependent Lon protease
VRKYLLIPLDDTVVFPNMTVTLPLDTADDERVLVVPRHESVYAKVGTVAEVGERARLPGGAPVVTLTGLHRALIGAAETGPGGRLYVEADERPDETPPRQDAPARDRAPRGRPGDLELRDADPRVGDFPLGRRARRACRHVCLLA